MSTISEKVQSASPGEEVDLYDLDLTSQGGTIRRFSNWTTETGEKVMWRGHAYDPVALEVTGYGVSGEGKVIRPRIKIGNSFGGESSDYQPGDLSALCAMYNDFVGCTLRRWRTFREYLDDGDEADPGKYFPVEDYEVSQLLEETDLYLEWELTTPIDQEGQMLPRGMMLQKHCRFSYRVWDASAGEFEYNRVLCPYEDEGPGNYFTEANEPTNDPALDRCSRSRTGCKLRFGNTAELPIKAYPGMVRLTRR